MRPDFSTQEKSYQAKTARKVKHPEQKVSVSYAVILLPLCPVPLMHKNPKDKIIRGVHPQGCTNANMPRLIEGPICVIQNL